MNEPNIQKLQQELAAAKQALSLIYSIDQIRDRQTTPIQMLNDITQLIADTFQTDICLLMLQNRETGQAEVKIIHQRKKHGVDIEPLISASAIQKMSLINKITGWTDATQLNLHLVLLPIIMGKDQPLGSMLLARKHTSFSPHELELLAIAEDQIDSAVMQGYAHHDLQQTVKELETIYHIDHIRDQDMGLDGMLNSVVAKLEEILQADVGFVMLYDDAGKKMEVRAVTHKDMFHMRSQFTQVYETADSSLEAGKLVCLNGLDGELFAIMCLPLILNEQVIGVIGVARQSKVPFSSYDRRLLSAVGSQMDTAIFESLAQKRLRRVLGRSVDPRVMERLLENPNANVLEGERRFLTVLYADIRGSTNLAEKTSPEQLVAFINAYLSKMTELILAHEGTLDKFVGDEVMALFGAPFAQENHALRAVEAGLAMQQAHNELLHEWADQPEFAAAPIGIGIATGEAIVGEMGSPQRSDYTAIGQVANLGARICSAATGGQVLISPTTYDLVQEHVQSTAVSGMSFKGIGKTMTVHWVTAVK